MNIQWYPGHMTKTRRQMAEYIKQVDAVCEVVDARIPQVSRNPDMDEIAAGRPRMMILNRIDLADPNKTAVWAKHFRDQGMAVIQTDSRAGTGTQAFSNAVRTLLADKIEQWNEKGLVGKAVRVMVVGIPNVGKSTFINRILGRKSAKAADRPGVTRGSQWFRVDSGIDLLDTPGILWPKFEDPKAGLDLAFCGSIKDEILDTATLAMELGGSTLAKYVEQAGLLDSLNVNGISTASGSFVAEEDGSAYLGWSGVGQDKDLVNPCSLLAFMGSIANEGEAVVPNLVGSETIGGTAIPAALPDGKDTYETYSAETCQRLKEMMRNNVVTEYGQSQFGDLAVCAKSGTAEVGGGAEPHAWFAGFIDDPDHPLAFVVLVENGSAGARVAGSVAAQVLAQATAE